jgi:hypothetical protein
VVYLFSDLQLARQRCLSFDKFVRDVEAILDAL